MNKEWDMGEPQGPGGKEESRNETGSGVLLEGFNGLRIEVSDSRDATGWSFVRVEENWCVHVSFGFDVVESNPVGILFVS